MTLEGDQDQEPFTLNINFYKTVQAIYNQKPKNFKHGSDNEDDVIDAFANFISKSEWYESFTRWERKAVLEIWLIHHQSLVRNKLKTTDWRRPPRPKPKE